MTRAIICCAYSKNVRAVNHPFMPIQAKCISMCSIFITNHWHDRITVNWLNSTPRQSSLPIDRQQQKDPLYLGKRWFPGYTGLFSFVDHAFIMFKSWVVFIRLVSVLNVMFTWLPVQEEGIHIVCCEQLRSSTGIQWKNQVAQTLALYHS